MPFAPGVRIDWRRRVVEIESIVVLRRGALELLACRPNTREHESILMVRAQAVHVYQAMGLIGLKPGSPARYDVERKKWVAPVGEALDLRACWEAQEGPRCVPVEHWLVDVERGRPPEEVPWVFAGSRTFEDGRFGAEMDGTVVCVVDFDTALVTVGALHSADNELLWLAANTEAIPPVGTRCTLHIRRAAGGRLVVEVGPDGDLRRAGKAVTLAQVARLSRGDAPDASAAAVTLIQGSGVTAGVVRAAVEALVEAGVDRSLIEVDWPARKPRTPDAEEREPPADRPKGGAPSSDVP